MARALTVDRLSVHYSGAASPALLRLSFELAKGSSLAVLGPAGAGKTTLLHAIAGLLYANESTAVEGVVTVGTGSTQSTSSMTAFPAVSLVPQDPRHLISGFVPTVADEIDLTLQQARIPASSWAAYRAAILEHIPIGPLLTRAPGTLSGGEIQTAALTIAAVAQPSILCLDEPANALDQSRENDLIRFVLHHPSSTTFVLSDSTLHGAILACEQFLVLEHGAIVFYGPREDFWRRLPEFQDLVTLGGWLEVWHRRSTIDATAFRSLLEQSC